MFWRRDFTKDPFLPLRWTLRYWDEYKPWRNMSGALYKPQFARSKSGRTLCAKSQNIVISCTFALNEHYFWTDCLQILLHSSWIRNRFKNLPFRVRYFSHINPLQIRTKIIFFSFYFSAIVNLCQYRNEQICQRQISLPTGGVKEYQLVLPHDSYCLISKEMTLFLKSVNVLTWHS